MISYYLQEDDKLMPIFGVSSMDEAESFVDCHKRGNVVESVEPVFMSVDTGSVDFESGWLSYNESIEGGELVEVVYDVNEEGWVQV